MKVISKMGKLQFGNYEKGLLRFITCGSVDDGKSTLIGRLLYDSKLVSEDQLVDLERQSKKYGTTGRENLDFALLVDGLEAEAEQGITIDVAYRFFSTRKRKFIVADTPGHEEYTRNMVTGGSTAELAILLVDAQKGIFPQTKRHAFLVSLLGIKNILVAVNKMDLVNYDKLKFEKIKEEFTAIASQLNLTNFSVMPTSGLVGDNIFTKSNKLKWFNGPTLINYLENIEVKNLADIEKPFRFPVQWVNRPNLNFRGYAGSIKSGKCEVGEEIVVLPSGTTSKITKIIGPNGELDEAHRNQAVTLVFKDEVDVSRGNIITSSKSRPEVSHQFQVDLIWMASEPMMPGRRYVTKIGAQYISCVFTNIKYRWDINNFNKLNANHLEMNEIACAHIFLDIPIPFDSFAEIPEMGRFIIIDALSNATVGAGMVQFSLRRANNIHKHYIDVTREQRSYQKGQKSTVIWFTGLSGSGKSSLANGLQNKLFSMGKHSYILDGDNVRTGLNKDLGFSDAERVENIRRIGEVSKLMVDAGLIVLVAFISPFRSERQMVKNLLGDNDFLEVFVDTPIEVCEQRDPKGLYKKARSGELKNFTGIDSSYEVPENPDLSLDGTKPLDILVENLVTFLENRIN